MKRVSYIKYRLLTLLQSTVVVTSTATGHRRIGIVYGWSRAIPDTVAKWYSLSRSAVLLLQRPAKDRTRATSRASRSRGMTSDSAKHLVRGVLRIVLVRSVRFVLQWPTEGTHWSRDWNRRARGAMVREDASWAMYYS